MVADGKQHFWLATLYFRFVYVPSSCMCVVCVFPATFPATPIWSVSLFLLEDTTAILEFAQANTEQLF